MCGIAGIVGKNELRYRGLVPQMLQAIKYRGPDDTGELYVDDCALGHVRLSIMDLQNGKQPMMDAAGNTAVVFNGEIYGYKDIKPNLNYPFSTDCDTEVILALYQKYGRNMIQHLPGMFAFALWDSKNKSLYCARDRFGEKPFYYAWGNNGEFIFASEIKAILASGMVEPVLDYQQLNHYLCYSYIYPAKTIYKNIFVLPPASQLILQNGKLTVERYWYQPDTNDKINIDEAVEQFRFLFSRAVKRQLVADVPVGAFLSGGLDSGSVVAVASQYTSKLTTVSFGFQGGVNELAIARTMAKKYDTNHLELIDKDFDIANLMFKMQAIYDEPMADPASIPAYLIAKFARENVKVVLTGDAGDELLGGYDFKYRTLRYVDEWRGQNNFWREKMVNIALQGIGGVRKFARRQGFYSNDPSVRLHEIFYHDLFIRQKALEWSKEYNGDILSFIRKKNCYVSPDKAAAVESFDGVDMLDYLVSSGFLPGDDLDNALRVDQQEYLTGNGMLKTDRTTMAVSLESRTPFLDVDLAEFCISLPFAMKVRGKEEKYILRRAFENMWTDKVRNTIKNGFASPIDVWMKRPEFQILLDTYLGDKNKKVFNVIDYSKTCELRKNNRELFLIWELLILSMWFELHPCKLEL